MRHEQKVLPTYLPACLPAYLNNSMEQRPFWKASISKARQKITFILCSLKDRGHFHNYQLSLSWARSISSTHFHCVSYRFVLILFSQLHLGLSNDLLQVSTKYLCISPPYVLYALRISFICIRQSE
jgi:hypothetical protein